MKRLNVSFKADGDAMLRGWLYLPETQGKKLPAITMTHGFAAVKEHALESFAEAFCEAGFVVLVHDHRNFGESDGYPRHDVDPWRQIADWRRAISYLESRPEVDAKRIGLWGTSYSGGHALVLGAADRRLKCVVSQVPTISGQQQGVRRVPPEKLAGFLEMLADDERDQFRGAEPLRQAVVSADPVEPAAYRSQEAMNFYFQPTPAGAWKNEVTVRSTWNSRVYEPGMFVHCVSPTPLLMIVATDDNITMTDLELAAFERAQEPKRLCMIPGGHFDPYVAGFGTSSQAAIQWFTEHLKD